MKIISNMLKFEFATSKRRSRMKKFFGTLRSARVTVVSVIVLLAVSVLAGTVYAVTLDNIGTVGDGTSRVFSWTIDTSQDDFFKPVTKISGKLGSSTESTQTVTESGYSGSLSCENEGDNVVTVTLGGDTSGGSAFYYGNRRAEPQNLFG